MTETKAGVKPERPYHHGDLRRALLEAALEEVSEGGAERLTLRGLAGRVGVSAMAPYRHFSSKRALLGALAEDGFERLHQRLESAVGEGLDAKAALVEQCVAYVRFAEVEPGLFRVMFEGPPFSGRRSSEELARTPQSVYGAFTKRLLQLVGPMDLDAARLAAWSFVHGLAILASDRRISPMPEDLDAAVRATAGFLVERLARSR